MKDYNHRDIESRWQAEWEKTKPWKALDDTSKKKFYSLIEFPYPSGQGIHLGHVRAYTGLDIVSRKRKAEGFNVLYPIGWDSFGLPTENYAIKTGIHPKIVTKENTDNFRRQLKSLGLLFDWDREIDTSDPQYYKWTQWIFLQFFKQGLAYKAKSEINWCPKDKIGLANEEAAGGVCDRCGGPVEKRTKEQWMLAITKYADRLDKDLDTVNFWDKIKTQQRNWIGKSTGAEIPFPLRSQNHAEPTLNNAEIKIFTTRPDTIFGASYLVVAPEHEIIEKSKKEISNIEEVNKYIEQTKQKTDLERQESKEKTGVELKGIQAINPATGNKIPVWVADYVLPHYGTGAIMAVPAHDERDLEFAQKFNLPIFPVIEPLDINTGPGKDAYQNEVEEVERNNTVCIIEHPTEDKFLCASWKQVVWNGFVTGGIEEGHSREETAQREVTEETGYQNIAHVEDLNEASHGLFYHVGKKQNRLAHYNIMHVKLADLEHVEPSEEEKAIADFVWIDGNKAEQFLTREDMRYAWRFFRNGRTPVTGEGILKNSGQWSGKKSNEVRKEMAQKFGTPKVQYKLRDWVFSRQRYWGEPIPLVHCDKDGWVAVPDTQLPVELPDVADFKPTDTGESPLANATEWINTTCPTCNGPARRETDVMPNWAGSSWYYLRYADPNNSREFAEKKNLEYWTPVDWYNGGMEHTTLHLLYSRFWHKFLFDKGFVPTSEPYAKRTSHGLILAEGGEKMSKSKGNIVNPDDIVNRFGADTLRLYEMFLGPFDQAVAWSEEAIIGPRRFIERVWRMHEKIIDKTPGVLSITHKSIKKVSEDIESLSLNTAVSALMIFATELDKAEKISQVDYETLLRLLAPFAPHVTEELWHALGHDTSIHIAAWPAYDPSKLQDQEVELVVQINGKVRGTITLPRGSTQEAAQNAAYGMPKIKELVGDSEPKKIIYVPDRILNIVL